MPLTSSSSSPDERRTLRAVACFHCRQRRSYCSKERPACSRCCDTGLECRYEEERRVRILESVKGGFAFYRQRLTPTTAILKNRPQRSQARTDGSADGRRDHNLANDDDEKEEDDYEDERPLLELCDLHCARPGSSDVFLRSLQRLCGLEGVDDNITLDTKISSFFEPGTNRYRYGPRCADIRLPPLGMARRLFAAQHSYIGSIFAFTSPADAFERALEEARDFGSSPNACDEDVEARLRYAKLLLVLAFGQLYSINQWVGSRGPPGFEYFAHALEILPDIHAQASVLFVEALALVAYFFQNLNCLAAASMYIGIALRMAVSLGLHQELELSGRTNPGSDRRQSSSAAILTIHDCGADDPAIREYRRRIWWSVYSLDRILAAKSDSLVTIQDEDISVQLPSWLQGEVNHRPMVVLWHHTRLSRLLGQIHATVYRRAATAARRRPKEGPMTQVESILAKLLAYKRDLPDELRFDCSHLSITSRESISIMALYHHCISLTVRPLLSHVVQKRLDAVRTASDGEGSDWKTGLSAPTVNAIETCMSSARDVIQMMTLASDRDLVATYGFMDGEHIVSATIVLVMACIALPSSSPGDNSNLAIMHAGLHLLRNMGDLGNDHIAMRHNRLRAVVHAHGLEQAALVFVDSSSTNVQKSPTDLRPLNLADGTVPTAPLLVQPCISLLHRPGSTTATTTTTSNPNETDTMSHFPALGNGLLDEPPLSTGDDIMVGLNLHMWDEESFAEPFTTENPVPGDGFLKWSGMAFRD